MGIFDIFFGKKKADKPTKSSVLESRTFDLNTRRPVRHSFHDDFDYDRNVHENSKSELRRTAGYRARAFKQVVQPTLHPTGPRKGLKGLNPRDPQDKIVLAYIQARGDRLSSGKVRPHLNRYEATELWAKDQAAEQQKRNSNSMAVNEEGRRKYFGKALPSNWRSTLEVEYDSKGQHIAYINGKEFDRYDVPKGHDPEQFIKAHIDYFAKKQRSNPMALTFSGYETLGAGDVSEARKNPGIFGVPARFNYAPTRWLPGKSYLGWNVEEKTLTHGYEHKGKSFPPTTSLLFTRPGGNVSLWYTPEDKNPFVEVKEESSPLQRRVSPADMVPGLNLFPNGRKVPLVLNLTGAKMKWTGNEFVPDFSKKEKFGRTTYGHTTNIMRVRGKEKGTWDITPTTAVTSISLKFSDRPHRLSTLSHEEGHNVDKNYISTLESSYWKGPGSFGQLTQERISGKQFASGEGRQHMVGTQEAGSGKIPGDALRRLLGTTKKPLAPTSYAAKNPQEYFAEVFSASQVQGGPRTGTTRLYSEKLDKLERQMSKIAGEISSGEKVMPGGTRHWMSREEKFDAINDLRYLKNIYSKMVQHREKQADYMGNLFSKHNIGFSDIKTLSRFTDTRIPLPEEGHEPSEEELESVADKDFDSRLKEYPKFQREINEEEGAIAKSGSHYKDNDLKQHEAKHRTIYSGGKLSLEALADSYGLEPNDEFGEYSSHISEEEADKLAHELANEGRLNPVRESASGGFVEQEHEPNDASSEEIAPYNQLLPSEEEAEALTWTPKKKAD